MSENFIRYAVKSSRKKVIINLNYLVSMFFSIFKIENLHDSVISSYHEHNKKRLENSIIFLRTEI